jgi:PPK2 family polyphosphate:nucleotide phosphotransferase
MNIDKFKVTGKKKFSLTDYDTQDTAGNKTSDSVKKAIAQNIKEISELQDKLYADGKYGILIIFQAMDAAGKDSAIKHVMSGVNPQGVQVFNFKQPSSEELAHDYLWRAMKRLPERGKIAIFNRSYYEDVLVVKVHKLYESLNIAERCKSPNTIKERYKQIKNFEDYLWENGIITVKFFLHLSKEVQAKRFLDRIEKKEKNWKFSTGDIKERERWDDYQEAYQSAIEATATEKNPWYVIPADKKWFSRAIISNILLKVMREIDPKYPVITEEQELELLDCKKRLLAQ